MSNPPRIDDVNERLKIKDQQCTMGKYYICGCGGHIWWLLDNGDCVCSKCLRAQVRLIVNELPKP